MLAPEVMKAGKEKVEGMVPIAKDIDESMLCVTPDGQEWLFVVSDGEREDQKMNLASYLENMRD